MARSLKLMKIAKGLKLPEADYWSLRLNLLKSKLVGKMVFGVLACAIMCGAAMARPEFAALTVDARTGQVLFADHADALRHPASLTKMMTLYVLFQDLKAGRISRDTMLHVSGRAASMPPTKLHLNGGSTISVDDAIKGLVTKSANDAAAAIAENLGGTEANFAARMTRVAHSIGMSHSTFNNASGLPNPGQYTTARDMATLGLRLMRDFPQYYPYFRITAFQFRGHTIKTHNGLLQHFEGTDGIKTGYIAASGYNLVTSTKRDDKRLVGVVLGARSSGSRGTYMMSMLENNFEKAKAGNSVAALAGSSAGVINPIVASSKSQTVNSKALAKIAADATHNDETDAVDATTASTSKVAPKVLLATLEPSDSTPNKLPFAVVSANDQPHSLANAMTDSWNIQVGAYPDKSQADARIASLRGKLSSLLANKHGFTMQAEKDGEVIYRARFAGFGAASAKKLCSKISRGGASCLAIAPQG